MRLEANLQASLWIEVIVDSTPNPRPRTGRSAGIRARELISSRSNHRLLSASIQRVRPSF